MKKPVVLIVLDGWGYREDPKDNAIAAAKKPFFDYLWQTYPHTLLEASGLAVGLPQGQMGNSEVGHTTIGAGTVIDTDLVRITKAIREGRFGENGTIKKVFDHVKKHDSVLHVQGLLGEGGVHAHSEHLYALLREAKKAGVKKVAIHVFTDGRDTSPQSAAIYLKDLEKVIAEIGVGFIASASGRFYAMDRDNNWDRTQKAIDAILECKGNICKLKEPSVYMEELYGQGVMDEHLEPIVFADNDGKTYKIEKNDAVFFFNFRADRARQLSEKILEQARDKEICFATLTNYSSSLVCDVAFPDVSITNTLASEISKAGFTQAHVAETEKFAHATYFLNGGREVPFEREEHVLIDSRKDVKTHDRAPKMRAQGIADAAIERIEKGTDFMFINFANPDMVGHTGNVPAIIEAIEETDRQLKRVVEATLQKGGILFVTADHGNAEINKHPDGTPHTAHTTSPVPAIITNTSGILRAGGSLADIAPTIFEIMGIERPEEMSGRSLLTK